MSLPLRVFYYCAYLGLRVFETVVALLPIEVVFDIGSVGGEIAYWLFHKRRATALANLRLVFRNEMSEKQLRATNRRHFQLLGANLLASVKAATMPSEKIWQRISATIPEELPRTGWLFAISHLSCWELLTHLGLRLPGYRLGSVYRRFYNPYIDRHVRRMRARAGLTLFDRSAELLKCGRFVRSGGAVGVFVDQGAGHAGLWTPLFNRLTSSSTLPAMLAIRTGTPVVPIAVYTRGRARWEIVISEPFFPEHDDVRLLTTQINRLLEEQIRRSPADWLWVHRRWKTNWPGFLFTRDRRRVFFPPNYDREKLVPFRILIVSPEGAAEAAATLPAVRAIQRGRPDTWIAVLTPSTLLQTWREVPEVAQVIEWEREQSAFTTARAIQRVATFDAAVVFAPTWRTALAVWLARIPIRVARRCGLRSMFFNLHPHKPRHPLDAVRSNLRIAKSIGANIDDPELTSS